MKVKTFLTHWKGNDDRLPGELRKMEEKVNDFLQGKEIHAIKQSIDHEGDALVSIWYDEIPPKPEPNSNEELAKIVEELKKNLATLAKTKEKRRSR